MPLQASPSSYLAQSASSWQVQALSPAPQVPALQVSMPVHQVPSASQGCPSVSAVSLQSPSCGSQRFARQAVSSSPLQMVAAAVFSLHQPSFRSQYSLPRQALVRALSAHSPGAVHMHTGSLPSQTPPWHAELPEQGLPSSQDAPSTAATRLQSPVFLLQVAAWQAPSSMVGQLTVEAGLSSHLPRARLQ